MSEMQKSERGVEIIPTCVPRSSEDLRNAANATATFCESIHIDIVDGDFAPATTWPFTDGSKVGEFDKIFIPDVIFDVHLMVSDPREIGEQFIKAGARSVIMHIESFADPNHFHQTIDAWRAAGVSQIGLAVLLGTPLKNLEYALPSCDFVHLLSVERIGAQGAPFEIRAIERVGEIHDAHPDLPIAVDGGINDGNIGSLLTAGATRFAIGSAIMKADNPSLAYAHLKSLTDHVAIHAI